MKVTESELRDMQKRVGCGVVTRQSQSDKGAAIPPKDPYKSKLERAYGGYLHGLKLAGDVLMYRYEAIRMKLMDGVIYVPDFYVRWQNGHEEYHEVKGYLKDPMAERGLLKLRVAIATWPHWRFVLVTRRKGQWQFTSMHYEGSVVMG